MNKTLNEQLVVRDAIPIQDINAPVASAEYYNMGMHRKALVVFSTENLTVGRTAQYTLQQATDDAGAGAKTLGDTYTFTAPTAGVAVQHVVAVDVNDLDLENGFYFLGVTATSGGTNFGSVKIILGDGRYKPE